MTKPFAVAELLARVRVAERHALRGAPPFDAVLEIGGLRVDRANRAVSLDGKPVRLTPTEFKLLMVLARSPGRVVTHDQLLREVWGPSFTEQHHYLRVYMAQLRHKIEADPARPRLILTELGVGYRLRGE